MRQIFSEFLVKFIMMSLLGLSLAACGVRSKQVELFTPPPDVPADLRPFSWIYQDGNFSHDVLAVQLPTGGTLFGDKLGGAVMFDGWHINSVRRLGLVRDEMIISEENNRRRFVLGNDEREVACDAWEQPQPRQYERRCDGRTYARITLDPSGAVIRIEQYMPQTQRFVSLTKKY